MLTSGLRRSKSYAPDRHADQMVTRRGGRTNFIAASHSQSGSGERRADRYAKPPRRCRSACRSSATGVFGSRMTYGTALASVESRTPSGRCGVGGVLWRNISTHGHFRLSVPDLSQDPLAAAPERFHQERNRDAQKAWLRKLNIACGGIETPRLLLNADSQVCHGLGNSNGMVGRCFMEHPHRAITPLVVQDVDLVESWTGRGIYDGNREFTPCLGLSKQVQEDAKILNARAHVYRTPEMSDDEAPRVGLFMAQAPNPKSRVLLSDNTDSLGMRRVRLDWQLTEL
jgi:hypothetical protein